MSNVLALPLVSLQVLTGNNEDWVDSIKYIVEAVSGDPEHQLDLRGIRFEMEVRRRPEEHEVVLSGSTDNGRLSIGMPPDYGFLIIAIPQADMFKLPPGDYRADIVASDDINKRVCIQMAIQLINGVTK